MPRRKPQGDDQLLNPIPPLMLQAPRPHKRGDHDIDPYESPPGAVPVTLSAVPLKRAMTQEDIATRKMARLEAKALATRYEHYLDLMLQSGGDRAQALADVFDLPIEEVRVRLLELHAEVRRGLGSTTLAETLEKSDLSLAARVSLLRKHAYSDIPAASLKALDMVQDLEGNRSDNGSFESFLRVAKAQRKSSTA